MTQGLEAAGLPSATVQLLNTTDRAAVGELLKLHEHIDVIVPRGGKGLIERISSEIGQTRPAGTGTSTW